MILFIADMTGYINPNFSFRILIMGGNRTLSQIGPFKLSFKQLTKSFEETQKELERRIAISPDDIGTLVRYGYALKAGHDDAQNIFSHVLALDSNNSDALSFFVQDFSTDDQAKINFYYKLESLDPKSATSCSGSVVYPLIRRAEEEWKRRDHSAFRKTVSEARRMAVKSGEDYPLEMVLTEEILLAIYDGDLRDAERKISMLAQMGKWHELGRSWERDALIRRLQEGLSEKWNDELEKQLFSAYQFGEQ
jgi:hypothetical protein